MSADASEAMMTVYGTYEGTQATTEVGERIYTWRGWDE